MKKTTHTPAPYFPVILIIIVAVLVLSIVAVVFYNLMALASVVDGLASSPEAEEVQAKKFCSPLWNIANICGIVGILEVFNFHRVEKLEERLDLIKQSPHIFSKRHVQKIHLEYKIRMILLGEPFLSNCADFFEELLDL